MKKATPPGNSAHAVQKFKLTVNARQAERHADVTQRRAQLAKGQFKVAKKAYKLARKLAKKAAKKARHLAEELEAWLRQNKTALSKRPVARRRTKAAVKKVPRQPRPVRRKPDTSKITRRPQPTTVPPTLPGMLPPV